MAISKFLLVTMILISLLLVEADDHEHQVVFLKFLSIFYYFLSNKKISYEIVLFHVSNDIFDG